MKNEADFRRQFLVFLKTIPNSHWIQTPTTGLYHSGVGTPDMLGVVSGVPIWIETKIGNNNLTVAQERQIIQWTNVGCFCYVVRFYHNAYHVMGRYPHFGLPYSGPFSHLILFIQKDVQCKLTSTTVPLSEITNAQNKSNTTLPKQND